MQVLFDVLRGDTVSVKNITFKDNSNEMIDLRNKYIAARVSDIDECGLIFDIDNITHPQSFVVDPVCYGKLQFSPPIDFTMSVGEFKIEFEISSVASLTGITLSVSSSDVVIDGTYDLSDIVVSANFDLLDDIVVEPLSMQIFSGLGNISDGVFNAPSSVGETVIRFSYAEGDVTVTSDLTITIVSE